MTITQGAGQAAVRLGVLMTLELGQVEDLTPDQAPALDVRVKQRKARSGEFLWSASFTSLQIMKVLHPLHFWQESLKVLFNQQEAGGGVILEVELTLQLRVDLDLALDEGMGDGEAPLEELQSEDVHIIGLCHPDAR